MSENEFKDGRSAFVKKSMEVVAVSEDGSEYPIDLDPLDELIIVKEPDNQGQVIVFIENYGEAQIHKDKLKPISNRQKS